MLDYYVVTPSIICQHNNRVEYENRENQKRKQSTQTDPHIQRNRSNQQLE